MAAKKKTTPKNSGASDKAKKAQPARMTKQAESTPKSGAGYAKNNRGYGGDLAGRGGPIQKVYKGGDTSISIGIPERGRGRTNQRAIDQIKRKKK
jgi:hypothetical protein